MELLIAVLGSSALASVITGIFSLVLNRKKKESGVESGVLVLLYDRIKCLGTMYLQRGSITSDEYEDLLNMHKVYHEDLHGNGFLDNLMSQVAKLPIQVERESSYVCANKLCERNAHCNDEVAPKCK